MRRRVLQHFLFSCCSSLRLGDLKNLHAAKLEGHELTFQIQNTYDKKLQDMMLPLTREAITYLEDAQREEGQFGFYNYTDQYSNRTLKAIDRHLLGFLKLLKALPKTAQLRCPKSSRKNGPEKPRFRGRWGRWSKCPETIRFLDA